MTDSELLHVFFTKSFEEDFNDNLMLRDYKLPKDEIRTYVNNLLDIPLINFFDAISNKYYANSFSTRDIPQFSSLDDATTKICEVLEKSGDNGYKYEEIGVLLRIDGMVRKKGADLKYGENHVKTASDFGLVQVRVNNVAYLSCFGMIYNDLSDKEKDEYLARFVLRNSFIKWIVDRALTRVVKLKEEMNILKPSTINRRKSNVKQYIDLLRGKDCNVDNILCNMIL